MKKKSAIMTACHEDARINGDELFFHGCLEILKKHYGYRLDYMKLETIEKKIADLYGHAGEVDEAIRQEIAEFVRGEYTPEFVEIEATGRTDKWKYKIYFNGKFYSWISVDETYFHKFIVANNSTIVFTSLDDMKEHYSHIRIRDDKDIGRWFDCTQMVA